MDIQRLAKGRQFSAVATKYSSTCIQVSHDQEIMDQIFLCIPPNWNPQFPVSQYSSQSENWYWVPPPSKLGESFPPPPAVAAEQVASNHAALPPTQESVKSLLPSGTLHLSKGKNFRNIRGQDPVGMFHQVLPSLTNSDADDNQEPSQGADTEIFKLMDLHTNAASMNHKVRDKGSIFECAAAYLSLKVIQRYRYDIGLVFRQSWANSSSSCPIYDLRGLIVEYGEKGELGCDLAYFVGGPTMTSEDVRDLALGLASCYKSEFIALFGDKEAYEAEMKSLENDKNYMSSILPTVLARALLCPIILHLPDGGKPIYFYPYPMKGGKALPQFGDYSRPPMRLSLWSNGQYSLLMPINYSDEFVDNSLSPLLKGDGGNGKEEDDGDEDVEKKSKNVCLSLRVYGGKVKNADGKVIKEQPRITLYTGTDQEKYDAANLLKDPLRQLLLKEFPPKDGVIYEMSDLLEVAKSNNFLRYRKSSDVDDPLLFLCYNSYVPKGHAIEKNKLLTKVDGGKTPKTRMLPNIVRSYRDKSITRVQELAENKLKPQIESASLTDFFESTADYPTMLYAMGYVNIHHATAVSASNGELMIYDDQYINCIPKANGPYAGDSNSGDQISGKDWLEKLPPGMRDKLEDLHGQYVIMPAWMLSMSALAVTSHVKLEDVHSSRVYFGKGAVEALLFHRYKEGRKNYIPLRRHSVVCLSRQASIDWKFTPVGDNSLGCEQLAKSLYPVPVDKLAEMTFDDEKTFVVESGCEVKTIIANGDYCKPNRSVTFRDGDEMDRHKQMVQQILADMGSKTKESSESTEKKPAQTKKQKSKPSKLKDQSKSTGGKRAARSSKTTTASRMMKDSSDGDSGDIHPPNPKKSRTTNAKKPAKSKEKIPKSKKRARPKRLQSLGGRIIPTMMMTMMIM